jgi:hypothetical protein
VTAYKVFRGAYLVFALVLVVYTASRGAGPALAIVCGSALFGVIFGTMVATMRARRRRRHRMIAERVHGWHFYDAISAATQEPYLRAAGLRPLSGKALTVAYGPGGINVWTGFRSPEVLLAIPWSDIADVQGAEIRNSKSLPCPGLSVLMRDGRRHDFHVMRRPDYAVLGITREQLAALVEDFQGCRPSAEQPTG